MHSDSANAHQLQPAQTGRFTDLPTRGDLLNAANIADEFEVQATLLWTRPLVLNRKPANNQPSAAPTTGCPPNVPRITCEPAQSTVQRTTTFHAGSAGACAC